MEFEDMQRIWDKQNNEQLFAVNTEALHKRIQQKSRGIGRTLNLFEGIMIGANLFSIFILWLNWRGDGREWYYFLIPLLLAMITAYVIAMRYRRQQETKQFEPTLIGDVNKAIAQSDILIKRMQSLFWWYIVPVFGAFAALFYVDNGENWNFLLLLVFAIFSYVTTHWEIRTVHRPKKRDLEALRELLAE